MSHTPGPWETIFDGALSAHKEHWRVISSTSGLTLAVMEFGRAAEANARLIAAAPDLRAALEATLKELEIHHGNVEESECCPACKAIKQARDALAAAKGIGGD